MNQQRKPTKSESSRVMRISGENYAAFTRQRIAYAKKHKLPRTTYDAVFGHVLAVMQALMAGDEQYLVAGKAYADLAEARGEAIRLSARQRGPIEWPAVCVRVGEDDGGVR